MGGAVVTGIGISYGSEEYRVSYCQRFANRAVGKTYTSQEWRNAVNSFASDAKAKLDQATATKEKIEAKDSSAVKYYTDAETALQNAKSDLAAKEKAVRAYFESKNITGANLDLAMRGCGEEMNALEMDGDKIKDSSSLDALISGTYKSLVSTTSTKGSNPANPPANTGGGAMTKDQIFAIKDRTARRAAIRENIELFENTNGG